MEAIRERYERALRQREDGSEDSGGDGNGDGKGDNDEGRYLVIRLEKEDRRDEDKGGGQRPMQRPTTTMAKM